MCCFFKKMIKYKDIYDTQPLKMNNLRIYFVYLK